jgi:hypothetical protein
MSCDILLRLNSHPGSFKSLSYSPPEARCVASLSIASCSTAASVKKADPKVQYVATNFLQERKGNIVSDCASDEVEVVAERG